MERTATFYVLILEVTLADHTVPVSTLFGLDWRLPGGIWLSSNNSALMIMETRGQSDNPDETEQNNRAGRSLHQMVSTLWCLVIYGQRKEEDIFHLLFSNRYKIKLKTLVFKWKQRPCQVSMPELFRSASWTPETLLTLSPLNPLSLSCPDSP